MGPDNDTSPPRKYLRVYVRARVCIRDEGQRGGGGESARGESRNQGLQG